VASPTCIFIFILDVNDDSELWNGRRTSSRSLNLSLAIANVIQPHPGVLFVCESLYGHHPLQPISISYKYTNSELVIHH